MLAEYFISSTVWYAHKYDSSISFQQFIYSSNFHVNDSLGYICPSRYGSVKSLRTSLETLLPTFNSSLANSVSANEFSAATAHNLSNSLSALLISVATDSVSHFFSSVNSSLLPASFSSIQTKSDSLGKSRFSIFYLFEYLWPIQYPPMYRNYLSHPFITLVYVPSHR